VTDVADRQQAYDEAHAHVLSPDEVRTAEGVSVTGQLLSVNVRREPLTYERHAPVSFFRDMIDGHQGDNAANVRLARHDAEMRVEIAKRDGRAAAALDRAGFESRINPNTTDGQGGYFTPPLWLIEQFATAKRPRRILPDLLSDHGAAFPMPAGVQQINVPVLLTGGTELPEPPLDPDTDTPIVDTGRSSPVVTVSGQLDVALQLLEQSPPGAHFDWAMFKDLTESYDGDLSAQCFYGTGTNGQFTGLVTAAPSATTVTYTDAAPNLTAMYPTIGKTMAVVGDNRLMPPQVWLMRTARWAWIATSLDDQHRPIVTPELAPPPVVIHAEDDDRAPIAIASLLGLPVYLTDSVSATLGATANQDQIVCCRPSDQLIFEGTPTTSVYLEVLAGTLEARFIFRNYAAFIVRHVTNIGVLGGTGFVVQSGF
jgi:hypothetical protein